MEWKRGIGNDSSKVFDERGRIVATCSPDDGTAIVRAVNTFDQAREALKAIEMAYENRGEETSLHVWNSRMKQAIYQVRKALAAMEATPCQPDK